jgi:hypothetical protein
MKEVVFLVNVQEHDAISFLKLITMGAPYEKIQLVGTSTSRSRSKASLKQDMRRTRGKTKRPESRNA